MMIGPCIVLSDGVLLIILSDRVIFRVFLKALDPCVLAKILSPFFLVNLQKYFLTLEASADSSTQFRIDRITLL